MMTIGTRFTWNNYPAILKSQVMEIKEISDFPCQYLVKNLSDGSEKWMSQMEVNKLAKVTVYRDYVISPDHWWGVMYSHKEYDGPEDSRIGTAKTIQDAIIQIDELIEMLESGELKAYRPMEAWSGGIADNH